MEGSRCSLFQRTVQLSEGTEENHKACQSDVQTKCPVYLALTSTVSLFYLIIIIYFLSLLHHM